MRLSNQKQRQAQNATGYNGEKTSELTKVFAGWKILLYLPTPGLLSWNCGKAWSRDKHDLVKWNILQDFESWSMTEFQDYGARYQPNNAHVMWPELELPTSQSFHGQPA